MGLIENAHYSAAQATQWASERSNDLLERLLFEQQMTNRMLWAGLTIEQQAEVNRMTAAAPKIEASDKRLKRP